eukprot:16231_1
MKIHPDRARKLYKLSQSSLTVTSYFGNIAPQNKVAIQLIQNLFKHNEQHNASKSRNSRIVQEALQIYNDAKEEVTNHALINSLLRVFSHFKQPEKISNIWNQINTLAKDNHAVSYPLLLHCCMKSNPARIDDAIQCLEWIKHQNYNLCIDEMESFSKNVSKLISSCSKDRKQIKYIHSLVDHCDDIYIKTALINAYGNCAKSAKYSLNVFESIPEDKRNNVCVGAIMKALMARNETTKLLSIYDTHSALIDDISNTLALKACIMSNNYDKGMRIHDGIKHNNNTTLNNVLMDFYSYFGDLKNAAQIFECTDGANDAISVAALMKGYVNTNNHEHALQVYEDNTALHDDICHVLALKSCIQTNQFEKGKQIERKLSKTHGIVAKTTLIDFYAYFGCIHIAESIFNSIHFDGSVDTVSVNAMMTGYIANGEYEKALLSYDEHDALHNDTSHILAVKACTATNDFAKGKAIHSKVANTKHYTVDMKNVLIDLYGTCKEISTALDVFDCVPNARKDIITINAMMKAYCNVDMNTECLDLFSDLKRINDTLECDAITFATALKACAQSTSYREGEDIHNLLKHDTNKHLLHDSMIQTHLIHMYGKSGMLDECSRIFDQTKSEISIWNAMIHAYGRNGDVANAEDVFQRMDVVKPDSKTYKLLISSYSHSGDADKAQSIWLHKIEDDRIKYDPFVVSALIDCFSRSGMILDGYELLLQYEQFTQNAVMDDIHKEVMWTSLLSGCAKHNDVEMAEKIEEAMQSRVYSKETKDNVPSTPPPPRTSSGNKTFKPPPSTSSKLSNDTMGTASTLMSNIFAAGADFDKVNEIRAEMKRRGWKKKPGYSEIDVYGTLHRFYAGWGYRRTPEYKIIDKKLEGISERMEEFGYKRDYSAITRQLKEWETPNGVLNRHGEKLAVIYGLLTTQPDYLIVVNKNLRICVDCHNWMKMVSKIEQRKLIIADNNRVHSFENGKCTCNDYW